MLTITGLTAAYAAGDVLRNVDIVVPSGASVALLGANGAGKTSLLKVAAGIGPTVRCGTVDFYGKRLDGLRPHVRSRLGLCLIPEGRGIFRKLTVRENVELYLLDGEGRLGEALERVVDAFPGLGRLLGHRAGSLSGGQQQMLALSRALVNDPRIVLADELSVGLAPIVVDEIFAVMRRLQHEGRSLLIVEQYVDRVLDLVDYVYILHKGRVVFVGEPSQCRGTAVYDRYLGSKANTRS